MNILVVGSGYVGLVSGTCFAELGHKVFCIDIDEKKINSLQSGKIPFYEPELADLVIKNIQSQSITFTTKLAESLNQADLVLICVGTPPKQTGQADLKYIFQAVEEIGKNLTKYTVIVTKSTVPVGTAQKIKKIISKNYNGEFDVASCPEFLREGSAVKDFMNPDRIVIGTENQRASDLSNELHEKLDCPKLETNLETAEMIKYASNAFLATKISFINEIANVCENVGADVEQVAEGMGLDTRIGKAFLRAGIGYGGSCFPKDVRALHHVAGQTGYPFQLLKAVVEVNNQQRWLFYKKIKDELKCLENKTIAVWGLSFKPDTDDVRESIAIDIIEKLVEDGANVKAYDPEAMKNTQEILGDKIQYCFTADFALENADCLVIITDWDEFKLVKFENIKSKMKTPLIIDGRNMFDGEKLSSQGIKYISVGR
ncbi:UDP-glucose/GDP-mannose dehydrogenase family protein [Candidatus Kuenenbacteria bacterium]|nr:UDP-glucose/GDP-mannose dehydrogenase family protein [Candidatus Kuenenbacteria bacterium]